MLRRCFASVAPSAAARAPPGPPSVPGLGTLPDMLARNGGSPVGLDSAMTRIYDEYYNEYGDVVSLSLPGIGDHVVCADPRLFQKIFQNEGQYPHGAAETFWPMLDYHDLRGNEAISKFQRHGAEWKDIRSKVQLDMFSPQAARSYLPHINEAVARAVPAAALERGRAISDALYDDIENGSGDLYQRECYTAKLVQRGELDKRAITEVMGSLLQAGVDTTSYERLRAEVRAVVGDGPVLAEHIDRLTYSDKY
eukprot:gene42995-34659_t